MCYIHDIAVTMISSHEYTMQPTSFITRLDVRGFCFQLQIYETIEHTRMRYLAGVISRVRLCVYTEFTPGARATDAIHGEWDTAGAGVSFMTSNAKRLKH